MNDLQVIQSKIYEIRGQRVMLDFDLAAMYGVETRVLNQAVKRNSKRFEGDDFMFRLTKDEATQVSLRSQIVTLDNLNETGSVEKPSAPPWPSCNLKTQSHVAGLGLCRINELKMMS